MKRMTRLLALCWLCCGGASAQTHELPRTSPESQGLRSVQVTAFFDSLLAFPLTEIHSVVILRHGMVVGEMYPAPFRPEYMHTMFSCSKTFTAAAVGIAISENWLRLTDRLITFFPEYLPPQVGNWLAAVTVEDLLTMRSGFVVDTQMRTKSLTWIRDYLAHPMNAAPGTLFQYDSIDTYLLSAIVQRVTGMRVADYLRMKVFDKMNIRQARWEFSPEGITTGGWGLYIQPESMAKFGQLLLQHGQWRGQQLIPARWVETMMTPHVDKKGDKYCYQMWTCDYPTAVRADGAYGQYIIVIPGKDMVVVITQCMMNDGKRERDFIWNTLLKDMQDQPLPPSDDYLQLQQRSYTLPLLDGEEANPLMEAYVGRTLTLQKNALGWTAMRFGDGDILEITDTAQHTGRVEMGYQQWRTSDFNSYPLHARTLTKNRFSDIPMAFHTAACRAWVGDELQAKIHFVDWMSSVRLKFRFDGDTISIEAQENYLKNPVRLKAYAQQ